MLRIAVIAVCLTAAAVAAGESLPEYRIVPDWAHFPEGHKPGAISAVATDSEDRVYLAHRGPKAIMVFDRDGKFLHSFGDEEFKTPHGLRIDARGNVWATDMSDHRVLKFSPEGKLLQAFGKRGQPGNGPDTFNRPTDIAFDAAGNTYISDGYGNSRVVKLDAQGKFIKEWGTKGKGEGEFNLPHSIRIDSRGRVLVGDRENNRIQVFDTDGKLLAIWKESGAPYGMFTHGNQVYIADGRANWIKVLDLDGKTIGRFGEKGVGASQFTLPHMLCLDSRGDVYVAEVTGKRIQKFTPVRK